MARTTKLTPGVTKKICDNIRLGMSYKRAAICAGIGERTFHRWKAKAEHSEEGRYGQFWQELQVAEMEGEQRLLANIKKAAIDGKWPAAGWILERRHPERWGKLSKVALTDPQGKKPYDPIGSDLRREILGRLLRINAEGDPGEVGG